MSRGKKINEKKRQREHKREKRYKKAKIKGFYMEEKIGIPEKMLSMYTCVVNV